MIIAQTLGKGWVVPIMDEAFTDRAQTVQPSGCCNPQISCTIYIQIIDRIIGNTFFIGLQMHESLEAPGIWMEFVQAISRTHPKHGSAVLNDRSDMVVTDRFDAFGIVLIRCK